MHATTVNRKGADAMTTNHTDLIRKLRAYVADIRMARERMSAAADALEAMQDDAARYVKVLQLAGSLIEVARMPNIEYVADDHNASVRVLRQAAIDAARGQE